MCVSVASIIVTVQLSDVDIYAKAIFLLLHKPIIFFTTIHSISTHYLVFCKYFGLKKLHCFTVHFHSLSLLVPTNALFYYNTCPVSVTKMCKIFKPHSYMFRSPNDHHQGVQNTQQNSTQDRQEYAAA
jgi:hypothetical protein